VPFICVLIAPKGSWNDFLDAVRRVESTARRLNLLSITAWLYQARQRIAFTLLPMLFRSGDYADGSNKFGHRKLSAPRTASI
jgi:hypothetical protein